VKARPPRTDPGVKWLLGGKGEGHQRAGQVLVTDSSEGTSIGF
jgi:hypothetical protein